MTKLLHLITVIGVVSAVNASRVPRGEDLYANKPSYQYPTPILFKDLWSKTEYYTNYVKKSYSLGIIGFGVRQFMSYAAHFCKDESQNGTIEIISVGSQDGAVDKGIIEAYRHHFGCELNITLIDWNSQFKVDFKTVDDLIKKRPNVTRNCALFIIWPEAPEMNDNYDINAVRKLQPRAVLTLYEPSGISGSDDFRAFLSDGKEYYGWESYRYGDNYNTGNFELDNYRIEELACQEERLCGNNQRPGRCVGKYRLVRLKRID